MNKLSKAWQTRAKVSEEREEKPRAYNSTLAAGTGLARVGKRGKKLYKMDSVCADEAMSRDGFACMACKWIWGINKDATVVHHIQGKNTHRGPERRFLMLYQVSLCEECHQDTESQNGHSRWLDIDVREDDETMGTQIFRQTKKIPGVADPVTLDAYRENVANWNPFEEQD